jgi:predicted transcriptional regulator of viral defense system
MSTRFDMILEEVAAARRPFHVNELLTMGMNRMTLSKLVSEKRIENSMRGVYRVPFEEEDKSLLQIACIATAIPSAVICARMAAYLHEMTEGNLNTFYFGIPWKNRHRGSFLMDNDVRFIKWRSERDLTVGVETMKVANTDVKITSRERTLVDIFRYSSFKKRGVQLDIGIDPEAFHEILSRYLHDKEREPDQLALRRIAKEYGLWDELSLVISTHNAAIAQGRTF